MIMYTFGKFLWDSVYFWHNSLWRRFRLHRFFHTPCHFPCQIPPPGRSTSTSTLLREFGLAPQTLKRFIVVVYVGHQNLSEEDW